MSEQREDAGGMIQGLAYASASLRTMEDGVTCAHSILWRSVILRAFQDAGCDLGVMYIDTMYRDAFNIRASALIWLRGNSKDFYEVCHLAGCDPKSIAIAAKDMFGALIHELQIPIDVYDARDLLAARGVES